MHAYKIETQVTESHQLHITLPPAFPVGTVEVIVLNTETPSAPSNAMDLRSFSAWLKTQAQSERSRQDIEAQIQRERAAWGDD